MAGAALAERLGAEQIANLQGMSHDAPQHVVTTLGDLASGREAQPHLAHIEAAARNYAELDTEVTQGQPPTEKVLLGNAPGVDAPVHATHVIDVLRMVGAGKELDSRVDAATGTRRVLRTSRIPGYGVELNTGLTGTTVNAVRLESTAGTPVPRTRLPR